jgi:glucose-1-phosphate thymidylyltransferase
MKGIILAGGTGTRLHPATKVFSKQLIPLYDKPMVYYPLSTLMLAGIREVLIITTQKDLHLFKELLLDGSQLGMKIEYEVQPKPNGIAEAFIIGERFIGKDSICLILGDNVFYGQGLSNILNDAKLEKEMAVIFGFKVSNPSDFGIANVSNGKLISIEEKPQKPKSNLAIPGLYFYPNDVVEKALSLSKSKRGELEITSLNQIYLAEGRLILKEIGRGIAWIDTGTPKSLLMASEFVHVIQERQGNYIACIEEIAFRRGFISRDELQLIADGIKSSEYGRYLMNLIEDDN